MTSCSVKIKSPKSEKNDKNQTSFVIQVQNTYEPKRNDTQINSPVKSVLTHRSKFDKSLQKNYVDKNISDLDRNVSNLDKNTSIVDKNISYLDKNIANLYQNYTQTRRGVD